MNVQIKKSKPRGTLFAQPSKSYAHRYLIASMLSKNESKISHIYFSKDMEATCGCIRSFGGDYQMSGDTISIVPSDKKNNGVPIFPCLESGSTLRFFLPIALTKYDEVILEGTSRLIERGISGYEEILKEQGILVEKNQTSIHLKGKLKAGRFSVQGNTSSQYLTGLLFALPLLNGDSVIELVPPFFSKSYIDMTLDVLKTYQISYEMKDNLIFIKGNQTYIAKDLEVEGDYSNASFISAFSYFENDVHVEGLLPHSLQGDQIYQTYFPLLNERNVTLDISNCIDLGPILFVFASLKHGATFLGTKRLAIKESNRIQSIQDELEKVGGHLEIYEDSVVVHKAKLHVPSSSFSSHQDHRIAMALSLLSLFFDIIIQNADAVKKSYPDYWKDLESLGVKIIYEIE